MMSTLGGVGGERLHDVLSQAHDLRRFSSLRNVFILCRTNNLYQDSPENIANDLIKIACSFRQGNINFNVFICGILPSDYISSKNHLLIKEANKVLKPSCSVKHISFIGQDANWLP